MNGHELAGAGAARPADSHVVLLLEQALADAKAGKIIGAALVLATGPGKPVIGMAGTGAVEMYTGCGMLSAQLMSIMQPPAVPSRIMRAG